MHRVVSRESEEETEIEWEREREREEKRKAANRPFSVKRPNKHKKRDQLTVISKSALR